MNAAWTNFIREHLPTRKTEQWKYADLQFLHEKKYESPASLELNNCKKWIEQKRLPDSILLVCVDGYFHADLSDPLPPGISLLAAPAASAINVNQYPFAYMNTQLTTHPVFLQVTGRIEKPIQLLFLAVSDNMWLSHTQFNIKLTAQANAIIFEEQISITQNPYFLNQVMQLQLEPAAVLSYYKLQRHNLQATHMAYTSIQQAQDSCVTWLNVALGAAFARDDVIIQLQGSGASCQTNGFYRLTQDEQYLDHHIDIQHRAAHSQSEMLFKGTAEKKARAVFNGRLFIEKAAQKISAYQGNHHLLLSPQAQMYAKPELEIYADDVRCKHGATTGQLDEDILFYLRSRGIPLEDAVRMVLQAFAGEIIQRINHDGIRQRVQEAL